MQKAENLLSDSTSKRKREQIWTLSHHVDINQHSFWGWYRSEKFQICCKPMESSLPTQLFLPFQFWLLTSKVVTSFPQRCNQWLAKMWKQQKITQYLLFSFVGIMVAFPTLVVHNQVKYFPLLAQTFASLLKQKTTESWLLADWCFTPASSRKAFRLLLPEKLHNSATDAAMLASKSRHLAQANSGHGYWSLWYRVLISSNPLCVWPSNLCPRTEKL